MTVNELIVRLNEAKTAGFGEQEVCVLPDGFDEPVNIDCAYTIEQYEVEDFPGFADYVNDFVICT